MLDLYHVCNYIADVWPRDWAHLHRHRDALKAGRLDEVRDALRARLDRPALRYLNLGP
jgi:hypothetical protein